MNFLVPADLLVGADALAANTWTVGVQICAGDAGAVCSRAVSTFVEKL